MRTSSWCTLLLLLATGCVSQGRYDAAVANAQAARTEADAAKRQSLGLQADLNSMKTEAADLRHRYAQASAALDKATADFQVEQADLDRLRQAQVAASARAALFRNLAQKLSRMVDSGNLSITLRDGRMVLQLPNDVLFDTGRTDIKPAGRRALEQIAAVLATIPDHDFQVAGNTDNVPIDNAQFASNWELSSARALVVVHFLVARGMDPAKLSAAGYGEFDTIASNDTPAGRAKNRRTEITVQPNIDELVRVPAGQ